MTLRRLTKSLPLLAAVAFTAVYTTACCCCGPPTPSVGMDMLRDTSPVEIAPTLNASAALAQAH